MGTSIHTEVVLCAHAFTFFYAEALSFRKTQVCKILQSSRFWGVLSDSSQQVLRTLLSCTYSEGGEGPAPRANLTLYPGRREELSRYTGCCVPGHPVKAGSSSSGMHIVRRSYPKGSVFCRCITRWCPRMGSVPSQRGKGAPAEALEPADPQV